MEGTHRDAARWDTSGHDGTQWDTMGHNGTQWDTRGHDTFLKNWRERVGLGHVGTRWDTTGHNGTQRDIRGHDTFLKNWRERVGLGHVGTRRDTMGHEETQWDTLGYDGHNGTQHLRLTLELEGTRWVTARWDTVGHDGTQNLGHQIWDTKFGIRNLEQKIWDTKFGPQSGRQGLPLDWRGHVGIQHVGTRRDTMGKMGHNAQHLRFRIGGMTHWDTLGQFFCAQTQKEKKKPRRPNVKIFRPQGPKFPKSSGGELPGFPQAQAKGKHGRGQWFFSPDFPFWHSTLIRAQSDTISTLIRARSDTIRH